MKIFIAFALFAIVSAVSAADSETKEQQDKRIAEHLKICREKFSITDEQLAQLKEGKITEGNEEASCFVNCFMEHSGILVDGKIQKEKAIQALTIRVGEEKANEAIKKCQSEIESAVGSAKCQIALNLHNCFQGLGVY